MDLIIKILSEIEIAGGAQRFDLHDVEDVFCRFFDAVRFVDDDVIVLGEVIDLKMRLLHSGLDDLFCFGSSAADTGEKGLVVRRHDEDHDRFGHSRRCRMYRKVT